MQSRLRQIESKTIKEGFAEIRISYDNERKENIYEVYEPILKEDEKNKLDFIEDVLYKTVRYAEKRESKEAEDYIKNLVENVIKEHEIQIDDESKAKIMYYLLRDFIGYGEIDVLMKDSEIEDISCNGARIPIFLYHRKYESIRTNIIFPNDAELDSFVITLSQRCGKHISISNPLLDATMPDGSRLQTTLAKEITTRGSSFTIRKFREDPFTPIDLVSFNTLSADMVAYLWLAIENGYSVLLCGGTACGKTSTLNAISLFVPPNQKIVSIEDTREINLPHENWIAGVTRGGFSEGKEKASYEIDMFDLLKSALRQRPQYLIVGEVRGREAFNLFQAMATGHTAFSTMHAESMQTVIQRLESPPINLPRVLLTSLDIVVFQSLVKTKEKRARRVKEITEITGMRQTTNELLFNTIYRWNSEDDTFKFAGKSEVIDKIMKEMNLSREEIERELRKREDTIQWMREKGIRNYQDVGKVVVSYYKEHDELMKKIRGEK